MIKVRDRSKDHNTVYSVAAQRKGDELQEICDTHGLKVGKVQDMDGRIQDVVLSDTTKLEAALSKAGFSSDGIGLWYAKVGERQIKLEADATGVGKAGEVVTVPEVIVVPIPHQLLQQTPIKRFQQI